MLQLWKLFKPCCIILHVRTIEKIIVLHTISILFFVPFRPFNITYSFSSNFSDDFFCISLNRAFWFFSRLLRSSISNGNFLFPINIFSHRFCALDFSETHKFSDLIGIDLNLVGNFFVEDVTSCFEIIWISCYYRYTWSCSMTFVFHLVIYLYNRYINIENANVYLLVSKFILSIKCIE